MSTLQNKFVVYTALFGDYDDLIDPKEKYDGCDFICFTDQENLKSDIWEIRIVEDIELPLNMMNRRYKILPHLFLSEYDQSLYVDANIGIIGNPLDLANKYLEKYDFAVPKHFARDCIYEEANIVLRSGRINLLPTIEQMKNYYTNGYKPYSGLSENNILFRNHNQLKIIMSLWWEELNKYEKRDQLCLGFILFKNNTNLILIDENSRGNGTYFSYQKHKLKSKSYIIKLKNYILKYIPFYIYRMMFLK